MRIKKNLLKYSLIGVVILLTGIIPSCKKESRWDMLKRTGKRITETREVSSFNKIYLKDNVNVIITQGNTQEVKVEGGENLVPLIKTDVSDGVLYLDNDNKCNWARSYKKGIITVYLTLPELRFIWHFGSGNIENTGTLECDTLDILTRESGDVELTLNANIIYNHIHGTSDITLHGKSPLMGIFHIGEGYLHAEDMQTDFTWAHTKASGNEYLNVRKSLAGKIEWAGSIYYQGNPATVEVEQKGNGKLIPLN